MVSPITVATQGLLNSPLSVAAVRGRLYIALEAEDGGSSDPPQEIAKRLAQRKGIDPMLRQKLLREDEEILQIIIEFMERMNQ